MMSCLHNHVQLLYTCTYTHHTSITTDSSHQSISVDQRSVSISPFPYYTLPPYTRLSHLTKHRSPRLRLATQAESDLIRADSICRQLAASWSNDGYATRLSLVLTPDNTFAISPVIYGHSHTTANTGHVYTDERLPHPSNCSSSSIQPFGALSDIVGCLPTLVLCSNS